MIPLRQPPHVAKLTSFVLGEGTQRAGGTAGMSGGKEAELSRKEKARNPSQASTARMESGGGRCLFQTVRPLVTSLRTSL